MQALILAVGQKIPTWYEMACEAYFVRLQRFMKCHLQEIPKRSIEEEGHKLLQKISPHDKVIALDIKGESFSTSMLAKNINAWQQEGKRLIFMIGGPDGLSSACLERANVRWSLSELTFPHTLARVILLEQLYRATSLLAKHPYHRE